MTEQEQVMARHGYTLKYLADLVDAVAHQLTTEGGVDSDTFRTMMDVSYTWDACKMAIKVKS